MHIPLVINEKYKGIIDDDYQYRIEGDVEALGDIKIELSRPLFVRGEMTAGGDIFSQFPLHIGKSLQVGGKLDVIADLKVGYDLLVEAGAKILGAVQVDHEIKVGGVLLCQHLDSGKVVEGKLAEIMKYPHEKVR